jgi:ATP-dependent DNA helicase RecQ
MYTRALEILQRAYGPDATFRDGQWNAIESVLRGDKTLVVQQTGWGKSVVYFVATKLRREAGHGPTFLISPLLSLARNQIASAKKFGLNSAAINSSETTNLKTNLSNMRKNLVDVVLITPEQLANKEKFQELLDASILGIGAFVIDEAHCISDWGHDFRPDYRRIVGFLSILARNVPVLATTATANQRVINDVVAQLGNVTTLRGPLTRKSLQIQVLPSNSPAERLAWLSMHVKSMPGTGIIYCLTRSDCVQVSEWLKRNGVDAHAYSGEFDNDERQRLENMLLANKMKCLVATVALGMGFDKPDIGFVIHFQRPGNIVAYYQQIGRAGRNIDNAYAILLPGTEDDSIQEFFIESAFPSVLEMTQVVDAIEASEKGLSKGALLAKINMNDGRIDKCIKYLLVENTIAKSTDNLYYRTGTSWKPNTEHAAAITAIRRQELEKIKEYTLTSECLMQFIAKDLDDIDPQPCGRCSNCLSQRFFPEVVDNDIKRDASAFLAQITYTISPRARWPALTFAGNAQIIPAKSRFQTGRALTIASDDRGISVVHDRTVNPTFDQRLIEASAQYIISWMGDQLASKCIVPVPSLRYPKLVSSLAIGVARKLQLPLYDLFTKKSIGVQQKLLRNSYLQCQNILDNFRVDYNCTGLDILLIDDFVNTRWTITVCAHLLMAEGATAVTPFVLTDVRKTAE